MINERPLVQGVIIDSLQTKRHDDAVWINRIEGGWRVFISIIDYTAEYKKWEQIHIHSQQRLTLRDQAQTIVIQADIGEGFPLPSANIFKAKLKCIGTTIAARAAEEPYLSPVWSDWINASRYLFRRRQELIQRAGLKPNNLYTDIEHVDVPRSNAAQATAIITEMMIFCGAVIAEYGYSNKLRCVYSTERYGVRRHCRFTSPLRYSSDKQHHFIISNHLESQPQSGNIQQIEHIYAEIPVVSKPVPAEKYARNYGVLSETCKALGAIILPAHYEKRLDFIMAELSLRLPDDTILRGFGRGKSRDESIKAAIASASDRLRPYLK